MDKRFIGLSLLFLLLLGCKQAVVESPEPIRPVKVVELAYANGSGLKQFPATVEPTFDAMLAFRLNGEISEFNVLSGEYVKKGDVIAKLDDKDFKLQVKQAKAKFDLVNSQHKRATQLFTDNLISSSAFDESKAQLDIAEAQLDSAKRNLDYTKLLAPFDGMVAQHFVEAYEFVQAKQPIIELQGKDSIDVAIQIPEVLMAKLPKSDDVDYQPTLVLDADKSQQFKVSLREFDTTPNPVTKSYKMVFSMPAPQGLNVLAGMTGKVYVEMDQVLGHQSEQYILPNEAVFLPNEHAGEDKHFVYRVSSELTLELVEVELVKIIQQGSLIKSLNTQLQIEDKIVAAGSHLLTRGQKVKIWSRERGL